MTCIIAKINKKEKYITMGGDMLASSKVTKSIPNNEKVFVPRTNNKFIVGVAGSYRVMQLLQYNTGLFPSDDIIEKFYNGVVDMEFMVREFVKNLKKLIDNDNNENVIISILIGYEDKLFKIQSDYGVLEISNTYDAIGSGFRTALGAMYVLNNTPIDLFEDDCYQIKTALEAASVHNTTVGGPFTILNNIQA